MSDPEHERQAWEWWTGGAAELERRQEEERQREGERKERQDREQHILWDMASGVAQRGIVRHATSGIRLPAGCVLYIVLIMSMSISVEYIFGSVARLAYAAMVGLGESVASNIGAWVFGTGRIYGGLTGIILGITWLFNLGGLPKGGVKKVLTRAGIISGVVLVISAIVAAVLLSVGAARGTPPPAQQRATGTAQPQAAPTGAGAPTGQAASAAGAPPTHGCGSATVRDANALIMRAQPAAGAAQLLSVKRGERVDLVCEPTVTADGVEWQKVRKGDAEGWMSLRYLERAAP